MSDDPFNDFLLQQAHQVITENAAGLFITQGPGGFPAARYCLGIANPSLTRFYMLTRASTRKLYELEVHPFCTWVFSSPDREDVVTVSGIARQLDSFLAADAQWDILLDKLKSYEAGPLRHKMSFQSIVGVEVSARRVELLSTRLKLPVSTQIQLATEPANAPSTANP
jgi:general stress protein 26